MSTAMPRAEGVLRDRIIELEAEKAELEKAIAALGNGKQATSAAENPRRERPARGRSAKRSRIPRAEREDQLIAEAIASPKVTNVELARSLDVTPAYISMLLKDLGASGRLRRQDGSFVATA